MNVTATPRDYGLLGRDSKIAEEMGLASAQWYQCPLPRKRLKELMHAERCARHPRHPDLVCVLPGQRRARLFLLAHLGGASVLPHLWRALWFIDGFALA